MGIDAACSEAESQGHFALRSPVGANALEITLTRRTDSVYRLLNLLGRKRIGFRSFIVAHDRVLILLEDARPVRLIVAIIDKEPTVVAVEPLLLAPERFADAMRVALEGADVIARALSSHHPESEPA